MFLSIRLPGARAYGFELCRFILSTDKTDKTAKKKFWVLTWNTHNGCRILWSQLKRVRTGPTTEAFERTERIEIG